MESLKMCTKPSTLYYLQSVVFVLLLSTHWIQCHGERQIRFSSKEIASNKSQLSINEEDFLKSRQPLHQNDEETRPSIERVDHLAMETRHETQRSKREEHNRQHEFCFRGEFYNLSTNMCQRCSNGTFMSSTIHSQISCYPCRQPRPNSAEKVLVNCTTTQNAIIGCQSGNYLNPASAFDHKIYNICRVCTNCSKMDPPFHQIRSCGISVDTLCCPHKEMKAVPKKGMPGFMCRHSTSLGHQAQYDIQADEAKPSYASLVAQSGRELKGSEGSHNDISCDKGQYLDTKNSVCKTCPDETFMPNVKHTGRNCYECKSFIRMKNKYDVINCDDKRNYPRLVDCLNRNYLDVSPYNDKHRQCVKCENCSYPDDTEDNCCNYSGDVVRTFATTTTRMPTSEEPTSVSESGNEEGETPNQTVSTTVKAQNPDDACATGKTAEDKIKNDKVNGWKVTFIIESILFVITLIIFSIVIYRMKGFRQCCSHNDDQGRPGENDDDDQGRPEEAVPLNDFER